MTPQFLDAFSNLEKSISRQRGPFALFALFEREDLPDRWDLIVAAPWTKSVQEGVQYLVDEIQKQIGAAALVELSRIVVVSPSDPPVLAINRAINVEHGRAEITNTDFFGLPIKHAFVITSRSLGPTVAA